MARQQGIVGGSEMQMLVAAKRLDRQCASVGWARFGRDVLASVLATGLATIAFSHLPREPREGAPSSASEKAQDRLVWQVEDVPVRVTQTFDSLAMFALPQVEPSPWSTAPVAPAEPLPVSRPNPASHLAAVAGEPARRRLAAMLPPTRPPSPLPVGRVQEAAHPTETAAATSPVRTEPARLLGWELPAGGLLPSGRDVIRRVASLGDAVAGAGEAIAEGVGLR